VLLLQNAISDKVLDC